jgi:hypothetical protein
VVVEEEEDCEKKRLLCSGMMITKPTLTDAIVTLLQLCCHPRYTHAATSIGLVSLPALC